MKKLMLMMLAGLLLGGCAAPGSNIHLGAGNSPQECAHQMVMGKVPAAQQQGYVERCSAGYRAAHPDDSGDTFKLHLSDKDKQQDQ